MRLLYESEVVEQAEQNPAFNETNWLNNLYVFQKIVDKVGTNVILLGSKTGKFTGEFDDLALYEWDGGNLQCFSFGRKGSGKSVGAMNFANQMHLMYRKPLLVFDRFGEYLTHARPVQDSLALKNLAAFGLKPLGFADRQYNLSINYLENKDVTQYSLDLLDFLEIHPYSLAKDLIEKILDISGDTESDMSKYDAARRYLDQALNENPRSFKQLNELVIEINEALQSESRKSKLLEANLRRLIENGYVTPKYRQNLKPYFQKRKFLNFVTSLKLGKLIPLQVAEAYFHYMIYQWKKEDEIPQTCVISEEHDLVSNSGSEKNFLKTVYQNIATKERKVSNIYYKITQLPTLIPSTELQQSDFMLTTRPRDSRYCDVFRWINEDEKIKESVMRLQWDDSSPIKQHAIVTNTSFQSYYPLPCWSQYHKETKQIWIRSPFKRNKYELN